MRARDRVWSEGDDHIFIFIEPQYLNVESLIDNLVKGMEGREWPS